MAMSWAPSILAPWRLAYGLRKHPSTILLIVQVLGILSYPLMENTGAGRAVFCAMSIAVLSLVLWVVNRATRSAERRVGKEWARTCRSWWSPELSQQKTT